MMKHVEHIFETALWNSRFVVLLAVISSLFTAFAMFYMATVDTFYTIQHLAHYASSGMDVATRADLRGETVTHIVEVIDGFLLAAVLLIFSMGLYELFISKIDVAGDSETSRNVLHIDTLDDLKNRLAKVILMILIVNFFEQVLKMQFETPQSLIYLSGGIALIGLALYLTHQSEGH
jgi:uncharacterized membrane protein YqhA